MFDAQLALNYNFNINLHSLSVCFVSKEMFAVMHVLNSTNPSPVKVDLKDLLQNQIIVPPKEDVSISFAGIFPVTKSRFPWCIELST